MADDLLRPELFDEPLARSKAELERAYGKGWLEALIEEMHAGDDEAGSKPDKDTDKTGTQDKFLPRRR